MTKPPAIRDLCFASHPDPTGFRGRYFAEREVNCTEPIGHLGDHIARDLDGRVLAKWKQKQKEEQ